MPSASRLLAAAALLAAVACGNAGNATPTPNPVGADVSTESQPIERLLSQPNSALQESMELVVRDRAALERVWANIHGDVPGPPPAVDFAQRTVIVVALGERATGGHAVRVDAVAAQNGGAVVRYTATSPGQGCMTTQMITSPIEVVSVPRVTGEVRFEQRRATASC